MPSTTGQPSTKTLRLASARRRVRAFLDQIASLEASDFPHVDGREALTLLKEEFRIRQLSLDRIPDSVSDAVVDQVCTDTSVFLSLYTDVLGFILRSTNVRNAFEVHFPLKRLIGRTLGAGTKLIMSSEWNFVPFTWPMNLPLLSEFVLVGGPAPESGNVLIIPLAGHEIGHSAWRQSAIAPKVRDRLLEAIDVAMEFNAEIRDRVLHDLDRVGHDVSWLKHACFESAIKQLEETFCDMFALYVFGPAFAFAFEYFLAPGSTFRSVTYPSSRGRVDYLLNGIETLGLKVEAGLYASWQDSAPRAGMPGDILIFADEAVSKVFPIVRDLAFETLRISNVPMCNTETIRRVRDALERGVPDGLGATLAEIVTAGWLHLRSKGGLSRDSEQDELVTLNELMLKSVEVSEFRLRVGHA